VTWGYVQRLVVCGGGFPCCLEGRNSTGGQRMFNAYDAANQNLFPVELC
jgi:hypothetical protein